MFWKLTRKKPFFCWNHQFESKFQTPTNHQDQEGIRLPTQIISFFSLFLANVHFFTFRLKTIISNEMEQHVFRFTNKLSPKTSQDASRQYISLYPPVFLFSFYLSFSLSFQISAWVYNIQIVDANNECFMEIFIHSGLKAFFTFFFFFFILFYLKRNTTRNFCAVVRGHKVDAMCSINTVMNVIWIFLLKSSR